jgi:thioredoxin-dependent peroxiredoxin
MENIKKSSKTVQIIKKIGLAFFGGLVLTFGYLYFDANASIPTKLETNQSIPVFSTTDVRGNVISDVSLKGKKTLVVFERFVGCPVCNVHVHQLMQEYANLKAKGIELMVVYESSKENVMKYATIEEIPFMLVADPTGDLYNTFGVAKSMGKVMKGIMFKDGMSLAKEGEKGYKGKYEKDGSMSRMTAEFLVGADGVITKAHYAKYLSDHISMNEIKNF